MQRNCGWPIFIYIPPFSTKCPYIFVHGGYLIMVARGGGDVVYMLVQCCGVCSAL